MKEKVLFEYVADEQAEKARGRLKVKIRRRGPWSGTPDGLCWPASGACWDIEAPGREASEMRAGRVGFRATLDALESMYRELYGTEGTGEEPGANQL